MKHLINSKIFQLCKIGINPLICLCKGHKWYEYDSSSILLKKWKCKRCFKELYNTPKSVSKLQFLEGIKAGTWKKRY